MEVQMQVQVQVLLPLSKPAALGGSVCVSGLYVLSLYLLPASVRRLPRSAPEHIRWRICMALLAALALPAASALALGWGALGRGMGLRGDSLGAAVWVSARLMGVFYLGPLLVLGLRLAARCFWRIDAYRGQLLPIERRALWSVLLEHVQQEYAFHSPEELVRNLLVGPVTEEVVFRGLCIMLCLSAYCISAKSESLASSTYVALWNPVFFSLAHVHHLYEQWRIGGWQQLHSALPLTVLQICYTGIFGIMAGLLHVRTGNLAAPIVSHMICNCIQLPDISFMTPVRSGLDSSRSELFFLYPYRYPLLILHALGLIGFSLLLFPLTADLAKTSNLWFEGNA
jgi:prenyl protein peptidase